ncbi:MAG: SCO family protein [Humidesulfovibrio sp.]|uniref:SCO family protein n=1 Tax=Humidesulfovibrio sp. TaxID=2910988 RepID=UPI0027F87BB1|nr:SCO family protein [Humidesulfovibrio sp.]MDQ7836464.1 SCO family protein [Humidesulfovibrio sp.]
MPRPAAALALALTAALLLTPAAGRLVARAGWAAGNALAHNETNDHTTGSPAEASASAGAPAGAGGPQAAAPKVGVTEHLGQQADLDAVFAGEDGTKLRLGDLVTMPTLLVPVYFSCPNECNVLLGTLTKTLPQVGLEPGRDYQVLAVSFNDQDTPATATKRKGDFLNAAGGFPPQAWRFLTGDELNIRRLMDSIGFGFRRQGDDFVHTVVLVALSPTGKITRYLYGIKPLPFDLAMAATEAAGGRTGLSIQRAVAMCYTYDPQGRRYVFDIMKVTGAGVLAALGLFGLFLAFGGKKRRAPKKDA